MAWSALARHFPADRDGNIVRGPAIVEQARGNIVVSAAGHLTAVMGADDLIVVHTDDATLVAPKSHAGEIKQLLARIATVKGGRKWL